MPTVFVTDGQSRQALAAVRSLGRSGFTIVCGEYTRFATSFASKYVDERVVYPSPDDEPAAFVAFMEEYLTEHDIDVLLPTANRSTRVTVEHRDAFEAHTTIPFGDRERFDTLDRKDKLAELAESLSVPHPKTIVPDGIEDAVQQVRDLSFPVVIKPVDNSGSLGIRFLDDPTEFESAYREIHRFYPCPVVQERLPPEGGAVGGAFLRWDGERKAAFAYRRLREYPPGGGPSTLRESIRDDRLLEVGWKLLEAVDWSGVAMVEFKVDSRTETPMLIEVNPRLWGSLHLPLHAGIDFPTMLVRCALGETVTPQLDYRPNVRCRHLLPGDIIHLLAMRNRKALREFFPLVDDNLYYDILSRDDPGATLGRFAALGRFSLSPTAWQHLVFRRLSGGSRRPESDRHRKPGERAPKDSNPDRIT
jgi:predicted ATP-grasp superfamily ATP-dependent carboligase